MRDKKVIGIDIGGSHVTASLLDFEEMQLIPLHTKRKEINSLDSAFHIVHSITECIKELAPMASAIELVGIAFPGPFDYKKGVSAIANVGGKYQQTFGLHLAQALKDASGLEHSSFYFLNDAHSFALGADNQYQLKQQRAVFLTLGTGFGSAFMVDGSILNKDLSIPLSGAYYDQPFMHSMADDYFSSRWILNRYQQLSGITASSVKEIAASGTEIAQTVFEEFGSNLGSFLLPWLEKFEGDVLVIGGNISLAHNLFHPYLVKQLALLKKSLNIIYCKDTEECILTGAAIHSIQEQAKSNTVEIIRKTIQPLLPASHFSKEKGYSIYPTFVTGKPVYTGYDALADKIQHEKVILIDGYGGVLWEQLRVQLHHEFLDKGKTVFWYDINTCLKPAHTIETMIAGYLNGDDPVFGKKYTGTLSDFFETEKLKLLSPDPDCDICIIYGTGAALSGFKGQLVYMDLPKNEIQYRMRAGSIRNMGTEELFPNEQMYKRFYFVDWPMLNKYKDQLLPAIDIIADHQHADDISWMEGNDFREVLADMLQGPIRARPWFEAGVWGGNWMKKRIKGLNADEVNYAWSFELITPENGIVIEGNKHLLEVSFDFLLYAGHQQLLGNAAPVFGKEFPIRFDFLDTYEGGNLSIQCHPRTRYIQEHFGESFTQDETYYILDCEPDATVYLGFQEDIQQEDFKRALLNAQEYKTALPVEKYIQQHQAHKHDLFLIPNGTVHASGKNNLVLEISSTPYIFTFKMYDWLRLDLNGKPRPINIEHAFQNLYFDRKGDYVTEKLLSKPLLISEWPGGKQFKLPTHEQHFYTVDRYEFKGNIAIDTLGQCHICMLVAGDCIEVISEKHCETFYYAETFVIPAAVKNYQLQYRGKETAYVVIAYVKETYCKQIPFV